jgi:glycerophosphoryl diester phosphodiesterase
MKRIIIYLTVLVVIGSAGVKSWAAPADYDVDKVMQALRSPKPGLVILTPHRGLWEDVPENTIEALQKAVNAGFETVEIDVRLDGDGTPWLVHDFSMDRLTTGHGFLSSYRDSTLNRAQCIVCLRDRHGNRTGYGIVSLKTAFEFLARYIRDESSQSPEKKYGFVLIVDLKAPGKRDPNFDKVSGYQSLKTSWKVLKEVERQTQIPIHRAVVFKIKGRDVPDPSVLERDLGIASDSPDFHFMPVLHPDDADAGNRVLNQYFDKPYAIGFEAVMEYIGQEPAQTWIKKLRDANRTVSGFPGWNEYPEGVAMSTGLCCVNRNVDPQDSTHPLDYSGSIEYQLQVGANWLTADTALFLDEYLRDHGLRNVSQLR